MPTKLNLSTLTLGRLMTLCLFMLLSSTAMAASSKPISSHKQKAGSHKSAKKTPSNRDKFGKIQSYPYEIALGLGGGDYNHAVGNQDLTLTPIETDFLTAAHQSSHLYYYLAFHYTQAFSTNRWLSGYSLGPSLYYQPTSFTGEVYQFKQPILNNYTYKANVHPINVYLEGELYLHSFCNHHITPFVFVGGGLSFIEQSYRETVTPAALALGVPASSALQANPKWDEVLAYELGAGIKINLNTHLFLAGRYVYQDSSLTTLAIPGSLGYQRVSIQGNSGYVVMGYRFS